MNDTLVQPCVLVRPGFNSIHKIDRLFNKPVILCINDLPPQDLPKESLNVYMDVTEPSVWCHPEESVKIRKDLDLILTKGPGLLENTSCKSVLFPFGTCWAKNTNEKEFGVSFLITNQNIEGMDGYERRHAFWAKRNEIKIPTKFYNSSRRPLLGAEEIEQIGNEETSKEKLFNYMFSIAIENTRETNYFTEKIVDCLQSKTIPIYYGCPNIEEFFNTDGMIVVDEAQDIIDACNSLTPELYEERKDAIEENYERSIQYTGPFYKRVFDAIEEHLGLESQPNE